MRIDPATRTFQALRIFVNRELEELDRFLETAVGPYAEGAHLRDALAREPAVMAQLTPAALDRLFAPESYLGMAERFVQRVLTARTPPS